jgi:hypothetical protein
MAKSDSFFIRGSVDTNGSTYAQSEIDLGSFVNLGVSKSTLLRIHNISVQYADASNPVDRISDDTGNNICFQLTTQSQSAIVYATDKSLVSSGSLQMYNGQIAEDGSAAADFATAFVTQHFDVAPQAWTQGYLVGVDSLFIGADAVGTITSGDVTVSLVLECTLESATQANSVALALSQQ